MFKRGVTARGAFAEETLRLESQHKIWRPFAYTLLAEIENTYEPSDERLLNRLYQSMSAGRGVFKITTQGRLVELDKRMAEMIDDYAARRESVVVHDMAASNGITSRDLFVRLSSNENVHVISSDYYDRVYIVKLHCGSWSVVFDAEFKPLQFVSKFWVLSAKGGSPLRYPVNRALEKYAQMRLLPSALDVVERFLSEGGGDSCGLPISCVRLVHPLCLRLARENPAFELRRHNVFAPTERPCDVVRVVNFLTRKHLADEQIQLGIKNVTSALKTNGLLVLARTIDEVDGRVDATCFVKTPTGWEVQWDLNDGYEDRDLVFAVR